MDEYFPSTCGERVADIYDEVHQGLPGLEPMVDALAEAAKGISW